MSLKINSSLLPHLVAHIYEPVLRRLRQEDLEFEARMDLKKKRDPVSKKKKLTNQPILIY
jgi:hypothetical protein